MVWFMFLKGCCNFCMAGKIGGGWGVLVVSRIRTIQIEQGLENQREKSRVVNSIKFQKAPQ